ncbi:MAG: hypothetical protein ACLRP9_01595 [Anaerovoracaceae bacterium]
MGLFKKKGKSNGFLDAYNNKYKTSVEKFELNIKIKIKIEYIG